MNELFVISLIFLFLINIIFVVCVLLSYRGREINIKDVKSGDFILMKIEDRTKINIKDGKTGVADFDHLTLIKAISGKTNFLFLNITPTTEEE